MIQSIKIKFVNKVKDPNKYKIFFHRLPIIIFFLHSFYTFNYISHIFYL
jgi:hypothetical protein